MALPIHYKRAEDIKKRICSRKQHNRKVDHTSCHCIAMEIKWELYEPNITVGNRIFLKNVNWTLQDFEHNILVSINPNVKLKSTRKKTCIKFHGKKKDILHDRHELLQKANGSILKKIPPNSIILLEFHNLTYNLTFFGN